MRLKCEACQQLIETVGRETCPNCGLGVGKMESVTFKTAYDNVIGGIFAVNEARARYGLAYLDETEDIVMHKEPHGTHQLPYVVRTP